MPLQNQTYKYAPSALSLPMISSPTYQITKELWVDGSRQDKYISNGSFGKPYKTIQAAINVVMGSTETFDGMVISIAPGYYPEALAIDRPITLRGVSRANTIIDSIISEPTAITDSYISLEHITFSYIGGANLEHVHLKDIVATSVFFETCLDLIIEGCVFYDDAVVLNSEATIRDHEQVYGLFSIWATNTKPWPPSLGTNAILRVYTSTYTKTDAHASIAVIGGTTMDALICNSAFDAELYVPVGATLKNCCSTFLQGIDDISGTYLNYGGYPEAP